MVRSPRRGGSACLGRGWRSPWPPSCWWCGWCVRFAAAAAPRSAAPVITPLEPAHAALAALAELRALDLPAHQRFAEHAFRLGQILRRYLEAPWPMTRPGDTTPELVRHLEAEGLSSEDVRRLAGLLRVWDRVKSRA